MSKPRVHSAPQAAMLAALGTLSTLLTVAYFMARHPPLLMVVAAPLWSLWVLSFVDWCRGKELARVAGVAGVARVIRVDATESSR